MPYRAPFLTPSMVSSLRGTLVAFCIIFFAGCAVPKSAGETSVGRRTVDGVESPFASQRELLISGLVDEALSLSGYNRYFDAEARLRQALYLEPESEPIQYNLALILTQTDQIDEAAEILSRLHGKDPNNPDVTTALAGAYHALGDSAKAIEMLKATFERLRSAKNNARAATVARAISNVSMAIGDEQRALCYSFEALLLSKTPEQVGAHALMLLGANLFDQAKAFLDASAQESQSLINTPLAKHALALSRYALGEYAEALAAEEAALDLINKQPDLGAEVNTAWWLMTEKVPPPPSDDPEIAESEKDEHEKFRAEVIAFRDRSVSNTLVWPLNLRRALDEVPDPDGEAP